MKTGALAWASALVAVVRHRRVAAGLLTLALLGVWWSVASAYGFAFWYAAAGAAVLWVRIEQGRLGTPSPWAWWPRLAGKAPASLSSLGEMLGALLPLVFVVVAAGAFVTAGFSWWGQLLAGVVAALLSWFAILAENGRYETLSAWAKRLLELIPLIVLGLVGAAAAVAIGALVLSSHAPAWIERLQELGGMTTVLALLALFAALVGVLIRLLAFIRSWVRFLAVGLLVVIATHRLIWLGLLPGYQVGQYLPWGGDLLAGLGCLLLLWYDGKKGKHLPSARSGHAGTARTSWWWIGFATIVAASATLLVVVPYSIVHATDYSPSASGTFGAIHPGTEDDLAARSNKELADDFAPLLQFSSQEKWGLTDAKWYLRDAAVYRVSGYHSYSLDRRTAIDPAPTLKTLPTRCRYGPILCYALSCRTGEGRCQRPHRHHAGSYQQGTEYVRVVRRDRHPGFFTYATPFGDDLQIVLQYWLFYRYDRWLATTFAGNFDQQHEGDWEAITIGLGEATPLFVAYSAHCGGNWFEWSRIQVAPFAFTDGKWTTINSSKRPALHPLVGVAQGSHANYIRAQDQRAPDWSSCGAHVSEAAANALSYVWNIRDHTGNGWILFPAKITPVTRYTSPMSFPGYWGASESIYLRNFRHPGIAIEAAGDAPKSPPRQPLWYETLHTIFCSPNWHPHRCSKSVHAKSPT